MVNTMNMNKEEVLKEKEMILYYIKAFNLKADILGIEPITVGTDSVKTEKDDEVKKTREFKFNTAGNAIDFLENDGWKCLADNKYKKDDKYAQITVKYSGYGNEYTVSMDV